MSRRIVTAIAFACVFALVALANAETADKASANAKAENYVVRYAEVSVTHPPNGTELTLESFKNEESGDLPELQDDPTALVEAVKKLRPRCNVELVTAGAFTATTGRTQEVQTSRQSDGSTVLTFVKALLTGRSDGDASLMMSYRLTESKGDILTPDGKRYPKERYHAVTTQRSGVGKTFVLSGSAISSRSAGSTEEETVERLVAVYYAPADTLWHEEIINGPPTVPTP